MPTYTVPFHTTAQTGRVAHSPYSFPVIAYELMSPGTRRYYDELSSQATISPCELSPEHRSPAQSSACGSPMSTPLSVHEETIEVPVTHLALRGRMPFVPLLMSETSAPSPVPNGSKGAANLSQPRLFFGQVPLEISMAALSRLIQQLTGVEAIRFDARGFGCYLGYFASPEEARRVKDTLNDRVLFDTHGAWFARNQIEHSILREYQPSLLRLTPFRLPRHMMSIRDEALLSIPSYHQHHHQQGSFRAASNHQQAQQQAQQQPYHVGGLSQPKRRAKMQQVLSKFYAAQQQHPYGQQ